MGKQMPIDPSLIDNLKPFYSWQILSEFSKEFFNKMVNEKPSYLVIDFYGDIYYGVIKIGDGKYLTNNNGKLSKTTFYKSLSNQQKKPFRIYENKTEYLSLWQESVDRLFKFLKRELPKCKVLVHQARFTKYYRTKQGEIKEYPYREGLNIDTLNELWDQLDEYVITKYRAIPIKVHGHYISYEEHPWGPFGLHFTMDYYTKFLQELIRVVDKESKSNMWEQLRFGFQKVIHRS
jgi:hypothetical protein